MPGDRRWLTALQCSLAACLLVWGFVGGGILVDAIGREGRNGGIAVFVALCVPFVMAIAGFHASGRTARDWTPGLRLSMFAVTLILAVVPPIVAAPWAGVVEDVRSEAEHRAQCRERPKLAAGVYEAGLPETAEPTFIAGFSWDRQVEDIDVPLSKRPAAEYGPDIYDGVVGGMPFEIRSSGGGEIDSVVVPMQYDEIREILDPKWGEPSRLRVPTHVRNESYDVWTWRSESSIVEARPTFACPNEARLEFRRRGW